MLRKGRFGGEMDPEASEYTSSMRDDVRLFDAIIRINAAHVKMLRECEIIEGSDADKLLDALSKLEKEGIEALDLSPELEDIHMAVEEYVSGEVGEEIGGKLHTAKSRNDQVSAAIRIALREEVLEIQEKLIELIKGLSEIAGKNTDTIMPGHTHLQVAEPTTFGHWLNSYAWPFSRTLEELNDDYVQVNSSPLGACALAGTSFPIDREMTSELLGFDGTVDNTIDAVGSRDFALQTMSSLAVLMTNLSRLAEEISLWSSTESDMIEVPDEFASTSSIMPQKKNPVVTEITRGKASRLIGDLMGGLNLMTTLPQSYNLDLQELTPLLWDAVDQSKSSLSIMAKLVKEIRPKPEKMLEHAEKGFSTATELADALVREADVPFRDAHAIVGKLVAGALKEGKELDDLKQSDLKKASKEIIGEEIKLSKKKLKKALDVGECIKSRALPGGPAPKSVKNELKKLEEKTKESEKIVEKRKKSLAKARDNLFKSWIGD
ncbi:hypothetical protein AKJ42_00455 [candidate division MSBL1 archaeon SCGC-AAA261C02]|uniref:Argininosuccinate lyase n=1 Tax=candidate division MSBL1 archaeon SCGC-AAA261C02 TaxID=1698272 RepID=A0A133V205_9EURY|nr:hypothetical protein AKJ42_00455 [candidate division MSBL1 archaeon SCGC-AAA261C02]